MIRLQVRRIKESNLSEIIERGTTRVALVSEIVGAENIGEKIEKLKGQLVIRN